MFGSDLVVLSLRCGTAVDGGLTVAQRSFGFADEAAVIANTVPAEQATLTSDGRMVDRSGWCTCGDQDDAVRYEVWATDGRVAHGFACSECRRITQTG